MGIQNKIIKNKDRYLISSMQSSDYPKHDMVMEKEGLHKVCAYSYKTGHLLPENPHIHEVRERKKILEDITDYVGNTPMVRLNNIAKAEGIKCELCK